ncbi:MAG: tRNA pseudouridine(38-40) synthase TruA [Oscillospiraceae bacterium]|nr:tRNA pseudouridine(38-40) synthase TruA [Oscillospiraceae bacterium]
MNQIRNLKVNISYNGAAYHGFQRQANAITVQEVAENALSKLLGEKVTIIGCSRTDAGVHAKSFCFNVRTSSVIPCAGFVKGLNALLPRDIAVNTCQEVDDGFHARYSAKSKEYSYLIYNGNVRDVFMQGLAYFYPHKLNIEIMEKASALFIGEHDFSSYCKAESLKITKSKKRGTIRKIQDIQLSFVNRQLSIVISGDGFLHNMVRIIAGTLIYVSEGKRNLDDIRRSLNEGDRALAGITLPPDGLYLNKVKYDSKYDAKKW